VFVLFLLCLISPSLSCSHPFLSESDAPLLKSVGVRAADIMDRQAKVSSLLLLFCFVLSLFCLLRLECDCVPVSSACWLRCLKERNNVHCHCKFGFVAVVVLFPNLLVAFSLSGLL
jgi:hypothetical protein